jgi:hypothetical protein
MPVTLDNTPGGPNSNSYASVTQATTYFSTRLPLTPSWDSAANQAGMLIMATRTLDALAQPFKTFVPAYGSQFAHYRIRRRWKGTPATTVQRLAWPRNGMFDRNNNPVDPTIIPQELIDATSELAGQLLSTDRTLDNSVITQGLSSLRAGSVSLGFKQEIVPQVIPDAVYNLLITSWLTREKVIPAFPAEFEIIGGDTHLSGEHGDERWWSDED